MFKPIYIIGFSGNRPNTDSGRSWAEIEAMRPAVSRALDRLESVVAEDDGKVELFSSAAEGADTVACEVAMERQMPLHLILPKLVEEFMEDFAESTEAVVARTRRIIDYAQSGANGSTFRVAAVSGSGSACYEVTNAVILEAADAMLFLWNGVDTGKEGGAGEFLRQTQALEMPYVLLNTLAPDTESYHEIDALSSREHAENGASIMDFLGERVANAKADADFTSVWDAIESSANQSSKWFRTSVTLSIMFHGGGAVIAGFAVSYAKYLPKSWMAFLSGTELLMVGLALILMLWHSRKHTQQVWLKCRFASELMRGYQACAGIIDPIFPNVRRHAPKWRRFALTSLLYAHRELRKEARSLKEVRAFYIENRIDDQHAYYQKQYEKAAPKSAFFQHIGHWMSWAALIAVFIAFSFKLVDALTHSEDVVAHHEGPLYMLKICIVFFLPVALPLIAGISNSLSSSLDLSRRKVRYKEMADLFDRQRNYLAEINDEQVLEQTVCRIEEVLLDEQIEWMASAESGQSH